MAKLASRVVGRVWRPIHRIALALDAALETFRNGGVATYKILQVNYGSVIAGKKVLVTGGGGGIGLAVAKKCIEQGATVVITGRDELKLERALSDVSSERLLALVWDVSNISIADGMLAKCRELLDGDIDVLVNNAAVIDTTQFLQVDESVWDRVYSTNSKALFFVTQKVCRAWKESGHRGRKVLNVSSQAAFVGATYPYRASKWDVAGLTQGLGIAFAGDGIIVNGIAPGIVPTDMQPGLIRDNENIYSDANPIKRFALPEEIAELALFMISDASNFLVGQTIVCDGGFSLR